MAPPAEADKVTAHLRRENRIPRADATYRWHRAEASACSIISKPALLETSSSESEIILVKLAQKEIAIEEKKIRHRRDRW